MDDFLPEGQDRDKLRAAARASLKAWRARAAELGLDRMTLKEIDAEIRASRAQRRRTRRGGQAP